LLNPFRPVRMHHEMSETSLNIVRYAMQAHAFINQNHLYERTWKARFFLTHTNTLSTLPKLVLHVAPLAQRLKDSIDQTFSPWGANIISSRILPTFRRPIIPWLNGPANLKGHFSEHSTTNLPLILRPQIPSLRIRGFAGPQALLISFQTKPFAQLWDMSI